ncbi:MULTISPECIES: helix-turn-helix transcriptional regulator [Stenotrophomonas maltophilia group]|uniref:helix-turn-helix transcriptional regulator n=1 Tax=Stenotrophomonas maltophilia group TaxID=995085 RepID=UPI001E38F1A9|nr:MULTISPECIES: helix-turn-helix domain-containing protein [Stenotrophomonas maltophilia group]MDQ4678873.1 helix-turn-helix domain-containing protein [Stenotrophomonas maltophilia group sp. RNC7]UGB21817.1 helix-turn-helix domain-containing protein [Stenotrophomonas maltophilia]
MRTQRAKTPVSEHISAHKVHMTFHSPSELVELLGSRIRDRRLAANISQATLADKAGVSRRALIELEAGRGSTLLTLAAVLKALGLQDELIQLVPVPSVSPMAMLTLKTPRKRARSQARDTVSGHFERRTDDDPHAD